MVVFQDNLQSITGHSYVNLVSMDVDPNDDSHVFASGRIGLYEFKDGKFVKEYNYNNSPLQGAATVKNISKDYVLVQACALMSVPICGCLIATVPRLHY